MSRIANQTGSVKKKLLIILLAVVVYLLLVTTRYWPVQQGVVLDEATGEPLAGVFVTARYRGHIPVIADYQAVCYHAAGTTTDAQGRYRLPSRFDYPAYMADKRLELDFFKPGYRTVFGGAVAKMRKDESGREQRFEELKRVIRAGGCNEAGISMRSQYPLYEAVFYEAKNLARTKEDMKDLDWIRSMAAGIATETNAARKQREADSDEAQFLKDHLK